MPETLEQWQAGGQLVDVGGLSLFLRREGDTDEVLLCLHGFPTSSFDYRKIWPALAAEFSLIAYDMPGYGFSEKPLDFGYTTFDQADALQSLLETQGITRVHVLAHDYGNTITQELLARRFEGELDFRIDSICFLNGALFPETHRPIFAQKLLVSPIGGLFGRLIPDAVFKKNLASVFGPGTRPDERELEEYSALFKNRGGKRIAHRLIRYMSERVVHRDRWVSALKSIDVPFLFINGTADPVSGKHLVERFREIVPEQQNVVELEGIGHFPHLEAPETVLRHIFDFHKGPRR